MSLPKEAYLSNTWKDGLFSESAVAVTTCSGGH